MRKLIFYIFVISVALGAELGLGTNIQEAHIAAKTKLLEVDQKSRELMSSIYEINFKMKSASKRRGILDNKMLWAEQSVKGAAAQASALESVIQKQRQRLSQRLRAIYKIGDESVVRAVFSSASSKDLNETMKFLKIISDYDFELIRNYSKNMVKLQKQKEKLNKEVKRLLFAKENLNKNENELLSQQEKKSQLLQKLKDKRELALSQISSIRNLAERYEIESLLDISFFENKGRYPYPVHGELVRGYGIVEDKSFGFQLSHKGLRWATAIGTAVNAIHPGRVAFVGDVPGHGQTVIIDHGDHYYSVYSFLDGTAFSEGDSVSKNEKIGTATDQVYFELRHFSESIDPQQWLDKTKEPS